MNIFEEKYNFDPKWKGPLKEKRVLTDWRYLIIFVLYYLPWICLILNEYITGRVQENIHYLKDYIRFWTFSYYESLADAHEIILCWIIAAVILSLLYIILLRWFTKLLLWTTICINYGLSIALIYIVFSNPPYSTNQLIIGIIGSIVILILLTALTIIFTKHINIICKIIKEATRAIFFFPISILFALFLCLFCLTIIISGLFIDAYLLGLSSDSDAWKKFIFLRIFNLVNCYGFIVFSRAILQITLAGSYATWYWTLDKNDVSFFTTLRFMSITLRYHLGTAAIGTSLLTLIRTLVMAPKLADLCGPNICCVLSNLINIATRNAYAMTAMHSTKFFKSANNALNLFEGNVINAKVISRVIRIQLFLGEILIIVLPVSILGVYCDKTGLYEKQFPAMFIIVFFISLLIITPLFLLVKTAVSTIFLCILEDLKRNNGTEYKPYFMSYILEEAIKKSNSD